MGTKVQCKSYFLGSYSMRDLNEDASTSSWSPFYEDKMLRNGQYYNGFMPMPVDGYSEYAKEVLKQTMLKHEAIFRNQVCELHRLYRIQRDLMDAVQRKEPYKHSIPIETSNVYPFSSRVLAGDSQKLWQIPTVPMMNSPCSKSFAGTEDRQSPLDFLKESKLQSDLNPIKSGVSANGCESLGSNHKKIQKRTFDLQLPAEVYIDSEDEERIEKEKVNGVSLEPVYHLNKNYGVEPERYVKRTLGTGDKPSHGDFQKLDSRSPSRHTRCLADLNEPIQGICGEEAEPSVPVNHLSHVACCEETKGKQLPMKQNLSSIGQSKEFFQDKQSAIDDKSHPNIVYSENEDYKQRWPSYNIEAGQSRSNPRCTTSTLCHENLPMSSERLQDYLEETYELPQFLSSGDQVKKEELFRGKATCGEISNRNSGPSVSNFLQQMAPQIASLPAVSDNYDVNAAPVLTQRKLADGMNHTFTAVQALSCFNRSFAPKRQNSSSSPSIQSPSVAKERWDLNVSLRSHLSDASELPSQNGVSHGFQTQVNALHLKSPLMGIEKLSSNGSNCSSYEHVDVHGLGKVSKVMKCVDVKSTKDMNFNPSLRNGFRDGMYPQGNLVLNDGEGKHEDPSREIPWLGTKPCCDESVSIVVTKMDSGFRHGCSQTLSNQEMGYQLVQNKIGTGKGPDYMKDLSFTADTKVAEAPRMELAGGPCSKIFGVPFVLPTIVTDQCHLSSFSVSCQDPPEIADTENGLSGTSFHGDVSYGPTLPNSKKKLLSENRISENEIDKSQSDFRDHINLNSVMASSKEQPPKSEASSINGRQVPTSGSGALVDFAAEIDLEAPVTSLHLEDIPQDVVLGANHAVEPRQLIQFEEDPQDILVRSAAEAIVAMSSGASSHLDDASAHLSSAALRESLLWFSEVVSLNEDTLDNTVAAVPKGKVDADNDSSDDGVDFFEAMTLKLTETKVEEYCCKPLEQENQKEEEASPSMFLTRPRKTQRRRGRQRRDFQKDILPGLVSLSRHEVTEDIQTIGGLMRATGCSWETGMGRRNAARNGWRCRARGRRRPRGSAAAGAGCWAGLLPTQCSNGEGEVEGSGGISLQGWGKTTRRCRRQRYPTGNISIALT